MEKVGMKKGSSEKRGIRWFQQEKEFKVGQTVRVFIKNITDTKIALSMKFEDENPWNGAAEKYAVGNVVKWKVEQRASHILRSIWIEWNVRGQAAGGTWEV